MYTLQTNDLITILERENCSSAVNIYVIRLEIGWWWWWRWGGGGV